MHNRRESNSKDFAEVDYQLQLITGMPSIQIISLYRIANPQINSQVYNLNQSNSNSIVIDITDFSKEYIQKVINKVIPLRDLMICCGHLDIHEQAKSNKKFTFLLGNAVLGRIGTHRDNQSQLNAMFIQNQNNDTNFEYNFFVNSHQQYNIEFQVSFTVGQDRQFKNSDFKCVNCQNKIATVYCRSQSYYFCDNCNLDHHRSKKILQDHEIQKLDKINTLPLCKIHSKQSTSYCIHCEQYLCMQCLQKNSSHGNNDHPVFLVRQLYEQKRFNNEQLSSKQRQKLQVLMNSLLRKKQEIRENYIATKGYIDKLYEKALKTLEQLYNEKLGLLNSDQIQLKMLSDKIQWSKTFIKFQQKNLKPIHYFQSQEKFQKQISKMKVKNFQNIFDLKADLFAEGEINVGKKDQFDFSRYHNQIYPQPSEVKFSKQNLLVSSETRLQREGSLYGYNQKCEFVESGDLASTFSRGNLNFFILSQ